MLVKFKKDVKDSKFKKGDTKNVNSSIAKALIFYGFAEEVKKQTQKKK